MELFSRFSSIVSYCSHAKRSVGFVGKGEGVPYRGDLYTDKVIYDPACHISENFLALVLATHQGGSLMLPGRKRPVLSTVQSGEEEVKQIFQKMKERDPSIQRNDNVIVIHPSIEEALPLRRWPFEIYLQLSQRLIERGDVFVASVGRITCPLGKEMIEKFKKPRMINLIGKTNVRELIALFNIATCLISHDSGIIHIGSLTRIPMLSFFGPETPVLYGPLSEETKIYYKALKCSPCLTAYNQRVSRCRDNTCLQEISVEEVYRDVCDIIEKRTASLENS